MMRRVVRSYLTIIMALVLGASSVTMAVARGQTRVAGEVVICSGYGLTTITVDADGNPSGTVHICPDMALAMFAAQDAPSHSIERPLGRVSDLILVEPATPASFTRTDVRARGPPELI